MLPQLSLNRIVVPPAPNFRVLAARLRVSLSQISIAGVTLGLGICAVPLSIAVTESLLGIALIFRIAALVRDRGAIYFPRVLWFWIVWVTVEIGFWLHSPNLSAGSGEIRHLLLPAAIYLAMPSLDKLTNRVTIWRGLFITGTIGSCFVIGGFILRLTKHWNQALSSDSSMYLRTGGLLHHWMIYATVEIIIFSGLLEFWQLYPEERRRLLPVVLLNTLAILVSLTRMLWICCFVLLVLHLIRRRSKWLWAAPLLPAVLLVLAPVRVRITQSFDPNYYSNAERLQMLRVGWKMIVQNPLTGVGPGQIEKLYPAYAPTGETLPAYHGHLHNNLIQLAAQFGLPVTLAAAAFLASMLLALRKLCRCAHDRDTQFLCRTAAFGLMAFLLAGIFDYSYGHSLAIILVSFVVLSPFRMVPAAQEEPARSRWIQLSDRLLAAIFFAESFPVIVLCAAIVRLLSRRSPFVAHLRSGQDGRLFWMWKLRTMWPRHSAASRSERGWVQKIDAEPACERKPEHDPRVTSRFALFCRRYSIDELPQLMHVIHGEMSFVGPRPLTRGELSKHYGSRAPEILTVRPGLTGYWQIAGRSRLSYPERVRLDLELVHSLSARVYFKVLLKTIPRVLCGNDAW